MLPDEAPGPTFALAEAAGGDAPPGNGAGIAALPQPKALDVPCAPWQVRLAIWI